MLFEHQFYSSSHPNVDLNLNLTFKTFWNEQILKFWNCFCCKSQWVCMFFEDAESVMFFFFTLGWSSYNVFVTKIDPEKIVWNYFLLKLHFTLINLPSILASSTVVISRLTLNCSLMLGVIQKLVFILCIKKVLILFCIFFFFFLNNIFMQKEKNNIKT